MSFFGGGGGVNKKTYTVTSADLLGAIVFEIDNYSMISLRIKSDALFDGKIQQDFLKNDDTWFDSNLLLQDPDMDALYDTLQSNTVGGSLSGPLVNAVSGSPSTDAKFPYSIRWKIALKATQGTCTIEAFFI